MGRQNLVYIEILAFQIGSFKNRMVISLAWLHYALSMITFDFCLACCLTSFNSGITMDAIAVTDALAYACTTPMTDPWSYEVREVVKDRANPKEVNGYAFAKAIATVKTYCRSRGNAWGCAAAYAHAKAWAQATISAHAAAWAEAVAKCPCDKEHVVAAEAYGHADEFQELIASVEAAAYNKICVDGNDKKEGYAAETCVQNLYATALAKVRAAPFQQQ